MFPLLLASPLPRYHFFFFFNDTAPTEIYTLSLHDALPISAGSPPCSARRWCCSRPLRSFGGLLLGSHAVVLAAVSTKGAGLAWLPDPAGLALTSTPSRCRNDNPGWITTWCPG